jgi:hypothetical protein
MQNLNRRARLVHRNAMKESSATLPRVAKKRNTSTAKNQIAAPGATIGNPHTDTLLENPARNSKNPACIADARHKTPRTAQMTVDTVIEAPAVLTSCTISNIFVNGATGPLSGAINGAFVCTRNSDGCVVSYTKRNDAGICIEHLNGLWQIKRVSAKGKNTCWAYVHGGCELAETNTRNWFVSRGRGRSSDQDNVIVVPGDLATRLVSVPGSGPRLI